MPSNQFHLLHEIDEDNLGYVLLLIAKRHGIQLSYSDFSDAVTFGDLCDVIMAKIKRHQGIEQLTPQQAFTKIKKAIVEIREVPSDTIQLHSLLTEAFPDKERRPTITRFNWALGTDLKILTLPKKTHITFVILYLASIIPFFFIDPGVAASTIVLIATMHWLLASYNKNMKFTTISELAQYYSQRQNRAAESAQISYDKQEVITFVRNTFAERFDIPTEQIQADTRL